MFRNQNQLHGKLSLENIIFVWGVDLRQYPTRAEEMAVTMLLQESIFERMT